MGMSVSKYSDLSNNELLARFCSTEPISYNDPFWNQLLAYNIAPPKTLEEQLYFDASTEALLESFVSNNQQTGNLGALVQVFITRASELLASPSTDNAMLAWQSFNALFMIRSVTKYLVEIVPEYLLTTHFDTQLDFRLRNDYKHNNARDIQKPSQDPLETKIIDPTQKNDIQNKKTDNHIDNKTETQKEQIDSQNIDQGQQNGGDIEQDGQNQEIYRNISNESRVEMLCDALIGLICDVPVTDNTYYLHLECINTLLVLMSIYIFANHHEKEKLIETSFIYRTIYQGRYGMHAPLLVKTLLQNFYRMQPAPAHMFGCVPQGGSLVINIASGLWNMLTFNTTTTKGQTIFTLPPADSKELTERLRTEHPVANQSCLLLLCMHSQWISEQNLFKTALLSIVDVKAESTQTPSKESNGQPPRIEMAELHRALCACAGSEAGTLLLYVLLHASATYRQYALNDPQPENMLIPILQCLYDAPQNSSQHIYMALIVLLILSEDTHLIHSLHQIYIKNPVWYTERALSEISLGGLVILVIIRTVQYNIVRVRDKYLHTNCLAALANMSSEFRNLHPYVAQRLVSLFETLTKRRQRLCAEMGGGEGDVNTAELVRHADEKAEELWEHICVLDEVLRMLLEILNSCLWSQLQHNSHLVYALLHKKDIISLWEHICVLDEVLRMLLEILNSCLWSQLQHNSHLVYALLHKKDIFTQNNHAQHAPLFNNIEMVIGYFSSRLQRVQESVGGDLGVTEVLHTIKKGAEQWSTDRLKKFPELKFRYVEEEKPEEFFTPYTWTLVCSSGNIFWNSENSCKALSYLTQC